MSSDLRDCQPLSTSEVAGTCSHPPNAGEFCDADFYLCNPCEGCGSKFCENHLVTVENTKLCMACAKLALDELDEAERTKLNESNRS